MGATVGQSCPSFCPRQGEKWVESVFRHRSKEPATRRHRLRRRVHREPWFVRPLPASPPPPFRFFYFVVDAAAVSIPLLRLWFCIFDHSSPMDCGSSLPFEIPDPLPSSSSSSLPYVPVIAPRASTRCPVIWSLFARNWIGCRSFGPAS